MTEVRSPQSGGRERASLLTAGLLVLGAVGFYVVLRDPGATDQPRNLLPYQAIVQTLPEIEQRMYEALRRGLPELEAHRARTSDWPTVEAAATAGLPPFATATADGITWHRFRRGATVQYAGRPADAAAAGWILVIQEPEPNQPPDPAPLDDEHHRLPDGTTLHIYIWTHRVGGRLDAQFTTAPQNEGWTELFATPPNPRPAVTPSR